MQLEMWDRIQELFLSAADLPAEQARFLDFACDGDTVLREEVESLLACDRRNGQGISAVVEAEAALFFDAPTPASRIGPYRTTA